MIRKPQSQPVRNLLAATAAVCTASSLATAQEAGQQRVIVTGGPVEENNVLASPSFNPSVFGVGRDVLDTPRSVSVVSPQQLTDAQVFTIRDLGRVTSSTYSPNVFGLTSLPTIRGQEGEIFYNGMRRGGGNNAYGLPLSFNAVDSIDVVKGPATVVFGPTQRVGGYINLVTKEPFGGDHPLAYSGEEGDGDIRDNQGFQKTDVGESEVKRRLAPIALTKAEEETNCEKPSEPSEHEHDISP